MIIVDQYLTTPADLFRLNTQVVRNYKFLVIVLLLCWLQTNEEVQSCRNNYEALNLQLLEDLPKFCEISVSVVTDCLRQFALIQEGFMGAAQKEFSKLLRVGSH